MIDRASRPSETREIDGAANPGDAQGSTRAWEAAEPCTETGASSEAEGRFGAGRTLAAHLIRGVLAAALFALAIWFLDQSVGPDGWRGLAERLRRADRAWLALALLANLAGYAVWALRWRGILRAVAHVPWWPAQRALLASVFVNTVVPFARSLGGLVRAGALGRSRGLSVSSLYGPTLLDQIGYSTMSVSLGALAVPFAIWSGGAGRARTIGGILLALGATALVAMLLRRRRDRILAWVRGRAPGAARSVEQTVASAKAALLRPATYPTIAIGGAAVWGANVLTFWLAGRAIGADFTFGAAAAAWSFGSIAGVASGTPGGVGTTESVAIVPLIAAGVPATEALASIVLARLTQYSTAIVLGGASLLNETTRRASSPTGIV